MTSALNDVLADLDRALDYSDALPEPAPAPLENLLDHVRFARDRVKGLLTAPATSGAPADLPALLAAMPGRGGQELLLDWPGDGQVGFLWEEPRTPHSLDPLSGVDYKVLHDDADTGAAIWRLLAQAIPTARAHVAQTEQCNRMQVAARGAARRLWARGFSLEEIADVLGGTAYDYTGLVGEAIRAALKEAEGAS